MGHPLFYPWEDGTLGEPAPYFQSERSSDARLVVQHPFIRFDPASAVVRTSGYAVDHEWLDMTGTVEVDDWSPWLPANRTLVMKRRYKLDAHPRSFFRRFQRALEELVIRSEEEFLWMDTGAWTAMTHGSTVFGLGNETLDQFLEAERPQQLGYVLISSSSLLSFTYEAQSSTFLLESCIGNRFVPFAEWTRCLERALSAVCPWTADKPEVAEWDDSYEPPSDEVLPTTLRVGKANEECFNLSPVAVVSAASEPAPRSSLYHMAMLRKPSAEVPFRSLRDCDFILAEMRGSFWSPEDFSREFTSAGSTVLFLPYLTLVSWVLDFCRQDVWSG